MADLPLRFIPVGSILGDQEGMESLPLPSAFSSGGGVNLWIDKFASVQSILGYTRQNLTPVLTNTGAAATRLRGLFPYTVFAAGAQTRQTLGIFDDAAAHYEFRKSLDAGVTWTFVADFGAGSINTIPDFAQQGNALICTNGVVAPRLWDGTTLTTAGGSQLAAPTIADAGSGLLNGNYQVRVVPIKSDGTRKNSSVTSLLTPLTNRKITSTWVADADVTVVGYEVYRTTGSGKIFYYEGVTATRLIVSFTSNSDDLALIEGRALAEYGDAPPVDATFVESHGERVWYGRTAALPRTWFWSDPGLPFSVYTAFNLFDCTDAESSSDVSTGATGNFLGMFVIWLERSIWTVSGGGTVSGAITDFFRRRTNAQTGTVSHRTVARIPKGAVFTNPRGDTVTTDQVTLAYLTPFRDVRLFDGDNDIVISTAKKDTLATFNYAQRKKAWSVTDTVRAEVAWVFPSDNAGEPNQAVVWNYRFGVWYTRDWPFACAIETSETDDASVLLAGEADTAVGGYCYLLWNGAAFVDLPIPAEFDTKTFYGSGTTAEASLNGQPLLSYTKRWRWIDLLFETSANLDLTVEWLPEESIDGSEQGSSAQAVQSLSTVVTGDGDILTTTDGSPLVVSVSPSRVRVRFQINGRYLHSRGLRLRISSNTSQGFWKLVGFNIAYQLLEGLKR